MSKPLLRIPPKGSTNDEFEFEDLDIIMKIKAGSHLHGINTKDSDTDYVGVFMPSIKMLTGFKYPDTFDMTTNVSDKNSSDDVDFRVYSLPKFLGMLSTGNPNIVELLYAPDDMLEITSDTWKTIVDNRDMFISSMTLSAIFGMANDQFKLAAGDANNPKAGKWLSIVNIMSRYLDDIKSHGKIILPFPEDVRQHILKVKTSTPTAAIVADAKNRLTRMKIRINCIDGVRNTFPIRPDNQKVSDFLRSLICRHHNIQY